MSVTHSMSVVLLRFCFFLLDMLSFVYAYNYGLLWNYIEA